MGRTPDVVRINQDQILGLESKARRYYLWINDPRGFGVSVQPGGTKSYVYRYRNAEMKERFLTVGPVDTMSLQEARKKATALAGEVASGGDPVGEAEAARQKQEGRMNFREFWERYREDAEKRLKPRTLEDLDRLWEQFYAKTFGHVPLENINRKMIAAFHVRHSKTPVRANRALSYLRASLSRAIEWGLLETEINPASKIRFYPEKPREFNLSPKEWRKLFEGIQFLENQPSEGMIRNARGQFNHQPRGTTKQTAAFFRLLCLTAMRRSESLELRWEEVDWENEVLTLQDSKSGRRVVFCGKWTFEILKQLYEARSQDVWVFENPETKAHLVEPKQMLRQLVVYTGIKDLTLHGIRHAVASHLAELGFPESPIIQGILGHRQKSVTGRYVHAARRIFQEAITVHEEALKGYLEGEYK
jgi:integrase